MTTGQICQYKVFPHPKILKYIARTYYFHTPETKICLPLLHKSKSLAVATIRAMDKYTQDMKIGCVVSLPMASIVSSK